MRLTAALSVLLMLAPVAVRGETAAGTADPLVVELARLSTTLREIVGLLRRQTEAQELDLLVKRLHVTEAQLAAGQRALKSAESERRSLEQERVQLETAVTMVEARLGQGGEDRSILEAEAAQSERELKRVSRRIAELTSEIGGLEDEIASRRADVRSWQSAVDGRLGSLHSVVRAP